MKQKNTKKLGNKIMLFCIVFAIVLGGCIAGVGYNMYRVNILERYRAYTGTLLDIAASQFDGDDIEECIRTLNTSEKYENARKELDRVKENSEISYIYAVYFPNLENPEQADFVMNGNTAAELEDKAESEVRSTLGEDSGESFALPMKTAFRDAMRENSESKENYIVNNTPEYGYQMTGYTVIQNSKGESVCVLAIDLSMNEINRNTKSYLAGVTVFGIVLLLLFLTILLKVLNKSVILPVKEIAYSAKNFVEQTLSVPDNPSALCYKQVEVHTRDEIEILADSLINMTDEIKIYMGNLKSVTAEKERIGAELDVAKSIQAGMLPSIFPAFPERPELDIYATMTPAKEVGGDFYDFFLIDDDHLAMVMADVSGKGVPAALFMVIAKTLLKNVAQAGLSPKSVLEKVNKQLCTGNDMEMFVTVWLGILEISTGKMTCANAGHEYPVLKRENGDYELLKDKHGFVLAGLEHSRYTEYEMQLHPCDCIFLYTDGVPEATNANNELYGTDRMLAALRHCESGDCKQLLAAVKLDIDAFVGQAPQFDDITMLCLTLIPTDTFGMQKLKLPPSLEAMAEVTAFVEQSAEDAGLPMKLIAQLNIAVDEIFSNIARYSGATDATVGVKVSNGLVTLRFADNGLPYDPTANAAPDITLSADDRKIGGLGLFMVKKFMDIVAYEYRDGLNILTLKKFIN